VQLVNGWQVLSSVAANYSSCYPYKQPVGMQSIWLALQQLPASLEVVRLVLPSGLKAPIPVLCLLCCFFLLKSIVFVCALSWCLVCACREAVQLMLEKDVTSAPVVLEDGSLAGILSESDVIWKVGGRHWEYQLV
jgi:hypothetical protein